MIEEKEEEKLDYFKNDEGLEGISKEVFESTYCYQGESVNGMFRRVADNLASVEKEGKEEIADKFYNTLKDFKFIPAGRILSNAGANYKATSYINCFVSGFRGEDQDSMESISAELARQALILKSEGGYGFCCSVLRPRGENIKGIGSSSPGMVEFLNMWDTQSSVITMGSGKEQKEGKKKIRKGAQMVTAYVWHPDIKEFITAKQTPNKLTKFNMSVLLTDKFLKAVENKENWDLIFPNIEEDKQLYKTYWNGDIEMWLKVGGTVKVYETLPASELYDLIMTSTYNRAEPGCLFIDTVNKMNNLKEIETINSSNPCQPGWATVLTKDGIKTFDEIEVGSIIWSKDGWTTVINKMDSGVKDVYEYRTTRNVFYGTENHRVLDSGVKIEAKDAINIDSLQYIEQAVIHNNQDIMDGLLIGDGMCHRASNNLILLCIGENDTDYFNSKIKDLIKIHRPGIKSYAYEVQSTITPEELPLIHTREIPNRFFQGDYGKVCSFLRGLYSANGSVVDKRVTFKTASPILRDQVQIMLSSVGINSYFTTNKKKKVEFSNGEYECKESYDINISTDRVKFQKLIGFLQEYKNEKLEVIINNTVPANRKEVNPIKSVKLISTENVYDITVDNESHTYWTGGCNVSNCGEQPLPVGGACLLGSINLTQFINENGDNWDYAKLEEHLPNIVRMLDNVIELTYLPLREQYDEIQNKRRIGIGVTGLGSALMMMQIPYGSPKALQIIEEYFNYQTNKLYQISSKLAEEKGAFPFWNYSNFLESGFIKCLSLETLNIIKEKGLRNSHLTSIQPTGNTGILAKNVSGGLEPVFMSEYIRTHGVDVLPEDLPNHTEWKDSYMEGDTTFKTYTLDGIKYKWSSAGNYVKESLVEDYAVKYLKEKGIWNNTSDYAKTTEQLSVSEHLETMKIISKYVDAAMSKTINLPNDYPFEDFKNLYLEGWRTGTIKGITTYRAGTMSAVLKSTTEKETPKIITERPEELDCKVEQFKNEKKDWIALVGLLNDKPHEIFTGVRDIDVFPIPSTVTMGKTIKVKIKGEPSRYDFRYIDSYGYTNTLGGLNRVFDKEYWNYGRLISGLLRSGIEVVQVIKIVDGLTFTNKGLNNWKSGVIRALKPFVEDGTVAHGEVCMDCGQETIVYEGGCKICKSCGNSHCA